MTFECIEIRLNTVGLYEFNFIKKMVLERFFMFYGKSFTVDVVRTDRLEKGLNGKVKAVISLVK